MVLIAFFSLQLSIFTCGFDTHAHISDNDSGSVTAHLHEKNGIDQTDADYGCHVHPSHTFVKSTGALIAMTPLIVSYEYHLNQAYLKNISALIYYPPKA